MSIAIRVWSAVEGLDFLHCQLVFFFESDETFEEFSDAVLYGLAGNLAIHPDKVLVESDRGPDRPNSLSAKAGGELAQL